MTALMRQLRVAGGDQLDHPCSSAVLLVIDVYHLVVRSVVMWRFLGLKLVIVAEVE